jgi:hypothetical protein
LYLYYQQNSAKDPETGFGEAWKSVTDSAEVRETLRKRKVDMVSMLAISTNDKNANYETLKYRGDMYFDIDNADLSISIQATKLLVKKLKDLGVHNYTVWLSGKKGFHVTVPAKVFLTNASVGIKWLPYIYGHMAENHFAVEGLDMAVYSGGKGRLWRQPNVKRKDNGQYKVPLRPEDLADLDVDKYRELASVPNEELAQAIAGTEVVFNLEMSSIFEDSSIIVKQAQEEKGVYRFETNPAIEMLSEVPGCITKLAAGIDVTEGANFNKAAMSLAGYLKSANKINTEIQDDLVAMLSGHNNFKSATYTSDRARKTHIISGIKRSTHDRSMGCNPAFILSLVSRCGDCVVCNGTLSNKEFDRESKNADDSSDGLKHNIFELGLAYYKELGPKTSKTLTTFIIEPISADIYYNREHSCFRREALQCNIKYANGADGKICNTGVTIEEDAWDSPALFKKQFKGIDNLAITCSEDDLADLRHYIMSKHNDIDHSIRTARMGISIQEVPFQDKIRKVLVYTEPGFTAAGKGLRAPVHYDDDDRERVVGAPCIHKAPDLDKHCKEDVRVAKDIFKVNEHWVCSTILGWVVATALKPHVMSINNEFPLLGITGRPGTGKTTLASLFADLAGCTYGQTGEPASANSTPAFIERYIAGSTSTPRILDEMNPTALRTNPKLLETVKGVWNGLEVGKGSITGNTAKAAIATRSVALTGPVAYISEQPQQDDALRQRSIEVILTMQAHGVTQAGENLKRENLSKEVNDTIDAFEFISEYEQRQRLRGIGKAIIFTALSTSKEWVNERLAKYAVDVRSARCHGRQKYSWRIILMGLDLYQKALMDSYGIDVSNEIDSAKNELLSRLLDRDVTDTGKDNCNNEVLQFIAGMSERSAISEILGKEVQITLPRIFAYRKSDVHLYIYIEAFWAAIMGQAKTTNIRLKYHSENQFIAAIKTEGYYESYIKGWLKLDLELLREAGINIDSFYSEEEFDDKTKGLDGSF